MAEVFGEDTIQTKDPDAEIGVIITEADPLKIDLDDNEFVNVMDKKIQDSRDHFKKISLYDRRDSNEEYYLGREIEHLEKDKKLKGYEARYMDNVIFEAEGTLKAVAISRVPDLLVKPGNDSDQSREIADNLTEIINSRMRKRENRRVLGMAYSHRPIYFIGCIKCVWDPEKGRDGDYYFEAIHPDNIDLDHTASRACEDQMDWVAHHYELSIKEILMRFPDKKKDLFDELQWDEETGEEEKNLASKIKISEIWFTWYKKVQGEWQRQEGVAWKYKRCVLKKMKNPYWDWEGEQILFNYNENEKQEVNEGMIRNAFITGQQLDLRSEDIYYNYFTSPKKPFIFIGYRQMGKGPMDETTRVEQARYLQDNVNIRGKQITEMANLARGKNVFSEESGLTAEDIAKIDMNNPNQDILVAGNLSQVHTFIPGIQPTAALFEDQNINRERIFSKMSVNAALRGVRGDERTATQTQLFKESDFTRIDDEVEDTINAAAEEMADWAMQMMKLFYTEKHYVKVLGQAGQVVFQTIDRDMIEDGMEVEVSASSVDKLRRKREAFELAGIGMIDPVSFFKDIEASDPEGRAEKLMLFNAAPELYMQQVIKGQDTMGMAQQLGQMPVGGGGQPTPQVPPQVPQAPPQM